MNFSLQYNTTYFKNKNRFPSILNAFVQFMRLFWKDFSRFHSNAGHYKKESNRDFILGKTGHVLHTLTVKSLSTVPGFTRAVFTVANKLEIKTHPLPWSS